MTIHKEGFSSILYLSIFLIISNLVVYFLTEASAAVYFSLFVSVVLLLFVLYFFRAPVRSIQVVDNQIIAPADGKVVVIEETVETEYFKDKRLQVSIFMSPMNVHINFAPVSGIISYFKYHKGKFFVASLPKSAIENERTSVVIKNEQTEILLRQVAGAVARRIVCYAAENKQFRQGDELGFIKFGSRVDLYLPLDTQIDITLHQQVTGKKTVIGKLV